MDFTNTANPFMNVYKEMLFNLYNNYLYHTKPNNYLTAKEILYTSQNSYILPNSSIDDILNQDSRTALDKIKNTALNIAYRIKISRGINEQLDYNWYTIRSYMMEIECFYPRRDQGTERRKSTLISELFKVYKNRFDEQIQCWKDLQEPMRYFINLFHQYKGLKQDRKMLEEK